MMGMGMMIINVIIYADIIHSYGNKNGTGVIFLTR